MAKKNAALNGPPSQLPRQGSNLDSSDPESDVLPVTPRGSDDGAEGARTPDLLGAIQALSQLSYSPRRQPVPVTADGVGNVEISSSPVKAQFNSTQPFPRSNTAACPHSSPEYGTSSARPSLATAVSANTDRASSSSCCALTE